VWLKLAVAYPISYRQLELEEMMEEHGVEFDHATLNRWVLKYAPTSGPSERRPFPDGQSRPERSCTGYLITSRPRNQLVSHANTGAP
jgi:hypothetical protein